MSLSSILSNILSVFSKKRIIVKFDNDWYDITELQYLHPNGQKIFRKYHMKDITDAFNNNHIHKNIKNPKNILEKYKINL